MFDVEGFEPWTGVDGKYEISNPRVLVLGDVRVDAPLSDRECILRQLRAGPDLIFTNFHQAVLGIRHWQEGYRDAVRAFWERTLFYNYNATHAVRHGTKPLTRAGRSHPLHARLLRDMLRKYKPTHGIVWGDENWQAVAVEDAAWTEEPALGGGAVDEPCRSVTLDGHKTLFTRISHPSAGFAHERWSPLLARFLSRREKGGR